MGDLNFPNFWGSQAQIKAFHIEQPLYMYGIIEKIHLSFDGVITVNINKSNWYLR